MKNMFILHVSVFLALIREKVLYDCYLIINERLDKND